MATGVYGKRKTISSSSPISKLGDDDLLMEVLIRLPNPRSAHRCKAVCKGWNSLISTPYFAGRFVSHHRTLSVADTDEPEPPVLTLSQIRRSILRFLPSPRGILFFQFSVLDTVKDLLLLGFWENDQKLLGFWKNDKELRRTHLLCNPFTKQWVALPLAPKMSTRNSRNRWIVKLVCEPLNSPGLDLDLGEGQVVSGRFRVVRMYDPFTPSSLQANVDVYTFCSRSGRWTKLVLRVDSHLRYYAGYRVVSSNGKLYWFNRRKEVVKWDVFGRDHGTLPTLIDGSEYIKGPYVNFHGPWVSEGALHIISDIWNSSRQLSVWRLEEEKGGGWIKRYEVTSLEDLKCTGNIKNLILDLKFSYVIGLHPEKSEIVFLRASIFDSGKNTILSCDLKEKKLKFLTYQDDEAQFLTYHDDKMFQPRVTLWPSPIPNHEKLRSTYNGSYNCWHPSSSQSSW